MTNFHFVFILWKYPKYFYSIWLYTVLTLTMVKKIPNSGSMSTSSPSVKTNIFFLSFLHVSTTWICWAATDSTGSSMRLNSSKQPQLPDCAKPDRMKKNISYLTQITSTCALNGPKPAWSWTRPVLINNADYINNKLEKFSLHFSRCIKRHCENK